MGIAGREQGSTDNGQEPADSGRSTPVPSLPSLPTPPQVNQPTVEEQPARSGTAQRSNRLLRVLVLAFVLVLSASIALYGDRLSGLGAYGYPGLFVLNLLASATLILPAPGLALAFGAGASLHPWLVGLAVGVGSSLGELTGYLAGFSGRGAVENQVLYNRVRGWMSRYGLWVLFVLGLIPNPLFDLAGITAGVMKIPVWQFLAATGAGKVLKATLIAYAGAGTMQFLGPLIRDWFAR